ncbi:hypothetical protein NKDENANG_00878 [Candidatus Entotheonellaceae bacterium PAL068K]
MLNIFVGNIPFSVTDDDLRRLFEEYGVVDRTTVITDRETGRSRGFGFVEMPNADEAQTAIAELHGSEMRGRTLTVNQARPREPRELR